MQYSTQLQNDGWSVEVKPGYSLHLGSSIDNDGGEQLTSAGQVCRWKGEREEKEKKKEGRSQSQDTRV